MKHKLLLLFLFLNTLGSIVAQEPRSNSFEDFVFKTPWAYKTGYSNETDRILKVNNFGPWTVVTMKDEISTLADSTDVFVQPSEFLYDPVNKKRYPLVWSYGLAKFPRTQYVKGKAGQTTKHVLNYTLYFSRVPADVKQVQFEHAPNWETPDEYYASTIYWDIDMLKRTDSNPDYFKWINTNPTAEKILFFTPLAVATSADGETHLDLEFRNLNNDSKYTHFDLCLKQGITLYEPVTKRSYKSRSILGFPSSKCLPMRGYETIAFSCIFKDIDPDVDVVDVYDGDTCIIKGLHLKPTN